MVIPHPVYNRSENGSVPTLAEPSADPALARRRLLKWLIGVASGAFVASFGLPAVALKSLSLPKTGVQKGDVLVLATGIPGMPAGQPLKLADLPVGAGVQVFCPWPCEGIHRWPDECRRWRPEMAVTGGQLKVPALVEATL